MDRSPRTASRPSSPRPRVAGAALGRRDLLRLLGCAFLAPRSVLAATLDPLRAVPGPIAALTPLELIGWHAPELHGPRWSDAKLLAEPAESLEAMSRAALADGVEAWARSGHRTLRQQRYLWNAKYRGQDSVRAPDGSRGTLDRSLPAEDKVRRILSYTAFPGTSRHHWGTDVDMAQSFSDHCADYLLAHETEAGGDAAAQDAPPADLPADCLPAQQWLAAHAQEYGWCRVYDAARGGFQPEPWHWSYLPFAVPALARYLAEVTPDLLRDRGTDGAAVVLDDFAAYRDAFLLGVHPAALPPAEAGGGSAEPPADDESGESPTVPVLP